MVTVHSSYFWLAMTTIHNTHNLRGLFWPGISVLPGEGTCCGSLCQRLLTQQTGSRKSRVGAKGWAATIKGPCKGPTSTREASPPKDPLSLPALPALTEVMFSAHFSHGEGMETLTRHCEITPVWLLTYHQAFLLSLMGQYPCMHTCCRISKCPVTSCCT